MWPERIAQFVEDEKMPKYRAVQAMETFLHHGATHFADISTWPATLRTKADERISPMSVRCVRMLKSSDGRVMKALLELSDGKKIETVLMSPKSDYWTCCISSQVGCAMACTFCATGRMGLMRNLTAEEICDQVLFWIHFLHSKKSGDRVRNIVYMGMGEPFANWENVDQSLRVLTDPHIFNVGDRHIAISTSGIVSGIGKLAKHWPQVNLAVSLHAADDALRSRLMPINTRFSLAKITSALQEYFRVTRRKVFVEYVLLADQNDHANNARDLIRFIQGVGHTELLHVNLIVYNKTKASYTETSHDRAKMFMQHLRNAGIHVTIRKNLGRDIQGACGQLAGEENV